MEFTLSIITICLNNLQELKKTISSVDKQCVAPLEHLIVDGSTNEDILNWYKSIPQPAYRVLIHERDEGISDAFNKGILRSKGSLIHLLHAGDSYYDSLVTKYIVETFEAHPDSGWLHGKYEQERGGASVITGAPYNRKLLYKGMRTIGHPTMVLKREMYDKYGLFKLNKRIAMDYDLLLRIRSEDVLYLNYPLVSFAPGGVSNTQVAKGLRETRESYENIFSYSLKKRLWNLRVLLLHKATDTYLGNYLYKLIRKS